MNASDLDSPALPAHLADVDMWSDNVVAGAGIDVYDVPIVSVGGGIGTFVTVDYLRVAGGIPAEDIQILSTLSHPWQTYEQLATASQIPPGGRIRSDSSSRPDNLWGFPSYAVQEAIEDRSLAPLAQVFTEPVLADFYTPRLGTVLDSLQREADRIRYWDMLARGTVLSVRRRVGGGYFTVLLPHDGPVAAFRSRDVHLAMGYPGLRFLPDLQQFRERYDFHHVVNAYEEHGHVYESLRRRPGTVLVRGAGIVAAQVLHRLMQDRMEGGAQTRILHLLRTYVSGAHGANAWSRRPGGNGFAYQGFNYPKSVWGGQLKARTRELEGLERVLLYDEIGGTTTPWREHWQSTWDDAREAGWYRTLAGTISELRLEDNAVVARLDPPDEALELRADFVIDCTGLDGDMTRHRVIRDLLGHGGASLNPLGCLDVERTFELRGTRSGQGRVYATGAAAYGGYFPGVDTFLGLQIAAQEIVDDIARRGYCQRMGPIRSTVEWFKWLSGRQI